MPTVLDIQLLIEKLHCRECSLMKVIKVLICGVHNKLCMLEWSQIVHCYNWTAQQVEKTPKLFCYKNFWSFYLSNKENYNWILYNSPSNFKNYPFGCSFLLWKCPIINLYEPVFLHSVPDQGKHSISWLPVILASFLTNKPDTGLYLSRGYIYLSYEVRQAYRKRVIKTDKYPHRQENEIVCILP